MSEDNAKNHANFADAFSMTVEDPGSFGARAIKIDKRLPYFIGGRGNVKFDGLRA